MEATTAVAISVPIPGSGLRCSLDAHGDRAQLPALAVEGRGEQEVRPGPQEREENVVIIELRAIGRMIEVKTRQVDAPALA